MYINDFDVDLSVLMLKRVLEDVLLTGRGDEGEEVGEE